MTLLNGAAKMNVNVVDFSTLIQSGLKGIAAVHGITQWGVIGTSQVVGTWTEYRTFFGGLLSTSLFPLLCMRALNGGARLRVSRAGHYTTVSDYTTLVGTKGTGNITAGSVTEVKATFQFTVTTPGVAGDNITIEENSNGAVTLATLVVPGSPTNNSVATAIAAATWGHGYTATASANTVTVTAPTGSGAGGNNLQITGITTNSGTWATQIGSNTPVVGAIEQANMSGGISAAPAREIDFSANEVGTYAQLVTLTCAAAANGDTNSVDISVSIAGFPDLIQKYPNFPILPQSSDIAAFNGAMNTTKIVSVITGGVPIGSVTLSGGTQDVTQITAADYIGDITQGNGFHVFDEESDFVRIAVPEMANPTIDAALAAYCVGRGDCRFVIRAPLGATGYMAIQYRTGTGAYNYPAINTFYGTMTMGGLNVLDPLSNTNINIPEIGDVLGRMGNKDNTAYEWFSWSGSKRGVITNVNNVLYNLYSAARATEADLVDNAGINAVVKHPTFGITAWGNQSLSSGNTMLKWDNVSELIVFIIRSLKPIIEAEFFDPNDITTWKNIYKSVRPFMQYIEDNRGLWNWIYQGDQDINDITKAVVNSSDNIDAGQYNFNLFIQPKVAMKYVNVQVVVTNTGVNFSVLFNQPGL